LIMFGGNGSRDSIKILARLRSEKLHVQCIVMCGHNQALWNALQEYPACYAASYTDKVSNYMHLADFFIGKPGPGSISEALHMGLPVIIEDGLRTLPQERYNTIWVKENALGLVVPSFTEIASAVSLLFQGDTLERLRRNALDLNNRAVYEIPNLLANFMENNQATLWPHSQSKH